MVVLVAFCGASPRMFALPQCNNRRSAIASYILTVCRRTPGVGDDVISATEPPGECGVRDGVQEGREQ
jgi:hypothetical protein